MKTQNRIYLMCKFCKRKYYSKNKYPLLVTHLSAIHGSRLTIKQKLSLKRLASLTEENKKDQLNAK